MIDINFAALEAAGWNVRVTPTGVSFTPANPDHRLHNAVSEVVDEHYDGDGLDPDVVQIRIGAMIRQLETERLMETIRRSPRLPNRDEKAMYETRPGRKNGWDD